MSHNLFVYGTLLVDEVRLRVVGRASGCSTATLRGYRRVALSERSYPGLVLDPAGSVEGLLCFGLRDDELAGLDRFEGDEYERVEVMVETARGAERAWTYLLSEKGRGLATSRRWVAEKFCRNDLGRFLREEGQ